MGDEKQEFDEKEFWDLLLSADKKDYERICREYGVTDFRGMLKKLNEKKQELVEEKAKVEEKLCNLQPVELKSFELELEDPSLPASKVFMYKNGVMVPLDYDTIEVKHGLKQTSREGGLYCTEVNGVKIFSTDCKIPNIEFLVRIQEVKAMEREDAEFTCVLSHPMSKIQWTANKNPLEQGEKFDIICSEDMLIHSLVIKDCAQLDKGIYTAVAGMNSCSNWLLVEADKDPSGKKGARKTTRAGGGGNEELLKIAQEQNAKVQKEREERMEKARIESEARAAAEAEAKAKADAEAAARKAAAA